MKSKPSELRPHSRRGMALVYIAIVIPILLGFAVFAIDLGMMKLWRTRCQNAADIAARSAAQAMQEDPGDLNNAEAQAIVYAEANMPNEGMVLAAPDVVFGRWDHDARTFSPTELGPNAVAVTVRRSENNGNPLPLIFAQIWGRDRTDIRAVAVAVIETGGPQFRFIIDDEMIDSDEKAIEDLARRLRKKPEDIIQDKDYDGWIDLPPGERMWLPTGQVGDEAFFDRTTYASHFPFKPDSKYTTLDFLLNGTNMQSIMGTRRLDNIHWRSSDPPPHKDLKDKKVLDPVPGIQPMNKHQWIRDLVDPDAILVSPIYKSDVGMAEKDPKKYGSPWGNMLGERRSGLIAFKILDTRDRQGSYLPEVYIEIVDGRTIDLLQVAAGDGLSTGTTSDRLPEIVH